MAISSISSSFSAYSPIGKPAQRQPTEKDNAAKVSQAVEDISSTEELVNNWKPIEVTILKTSAQWTEELNNEIQKFRIDPLEKSNTALSQVVSQMDTVNADVLSVNKKIRSSDWDFALKDGVLEVTGASVSEKDKKSIENILNSNKTLVKAVKDFYDSTVTYYQNAPGHTSSFSTGILTNENATFFNNVKEDISGSLSIKSLLVKTDAEASRTLTPGNENHTYDYVMDHVKNYLTASHNAVYEWTNVAEVLYKKE